MIFLTGLINIILGSLWRGYVLSVLWSWFMVTTFNLPELAVFPAMGVSLVILYMTYHHKPNLVEDNRSDAHKILESFLIIFLYPLVILGIGWVYNQFM